MYTRGYDGSTAMLVAYWSGRTNTEEDYGHFLADIAELDRSAGAHGIPSIIVVEVAPDNPRPTSVQRKKLIEAVDAQTAAPKHYFALVTQSALVRGVLTTINWFVSENAHRVYGSHSTFAEAASWVEKRIPNSRARLEELQREARRQAQRAGLR